MCAELTYAAGRKETVVINVDLKYVVSACLVVAILAAVMGFAAHIPVEHDVGHVSCILSIFFLG